MTNKDSPRPTLSVAQVILDSVDDLFAKLVRRLDGIDDAEYLWEPVAHVWTVRQSGEGIHVDMDPDRDISPAPVTTIAWRLWHLSTDCFADYTANFAGLATDEIDTSWTLDAADAVARLEMSWGAFRATLAGFDDWFAELGDNWDPWHRHCVADFAMHASNELVHHGAEIALLRDLYAHRSS